MKLKFLMATSIIAGALSAPTFAADNENIDPYSECGIGASLFKNDTGALVSNIIWDLGTTALTSALSSPSTCADRKTETAKFIYKSYNEVAEQTAKGQGEHLTAMLNLAGCASSDHAAVIQSVRADFADTINESAYSEKTQLEKAKGYYNIVRANSANCSLS